MSESPEDRHDSIESDAREARLGELINTYFDRRESGEEVSPDAFLREHPEYADELRDHLAGLNLLDGIGSSRQPMLADDETAIATGSSNQIQFMDSEPPLPEVPGYEILKLIGRGGMGLIYKATQLSTKRPVALKLLLEGPLASTQSKRRFEREIALAAKLRHTNIIPIYDSGNCDGRLFYAMEYVRGETLAAYSEKHKLMISQKLVIFEKICQAVGHAHQRGVIHRDLKPSNILIDSSAEPHILDFGLAKAGAHIDMTTSITAQIVGTPAYMSPEQASGDPDAIDVRTDIYSLGVVLYEFLTGHMPYETRVPMGKLLENVAIAEPEPPRKYNAKIDGELTAILMKALEKSKESRYQSLDGLYSDVKCYLAGEPISVRPASILYLAKRAILKQRRAVGIVAGLVILAVTIGLIINHFSATIEKQSRQREAEKVQFAEKFAKHEELSARETEWLQAERDKAERARLTQELVLKQLDPDLARAVQNISKGLQGVGRGEDAATTVLRLFAQNIGDLRPPGRENSGKDMELDPDDLAALQMSRRPPSITGEDPPPVPEESTLTELIALLTTPRDVDPKKKSSTTSQPATSQPADGAAKAGSDRKPTSSPNNNSEAGGADADVTHGNQP